MQAILSTLFLLSSLVLAQVTVIITDETTVTTTTRTLSANDTAAGPTSVPLLNILHGPSGNTTYIPHTYLGRVLAIEAENTVYAVSCLVAANSTACGNTPITVTQGSATFVRVDAMTTTAAPSPSFNNSGVARATGTALVTTLLRQADSNEAGSSLSCSLTNSSAVCVNHMVLPPIPTVSALVALPSAGFGNRTSVLTSTFAKSDIVWDVLVITSGIELVNAAVATPVNGSGLVQEASRTPVGPTSTPNVILAESANRKQNTSVSAGNGLSLGWKAPVFMTATSLFMVVLSLL